MQPRPVARLCWTWRRLAAASIFAQPCLPPRACNVDEAGAGADSAADSAAGVGAAAGLFGGARAAGIGAAFVRSKGGISGMKQGAKSTMSGAYSKRGSAWQNAG